MTQKWQRNDKKMTKKWQHKSKMTNPNAKKMRKKWQNNYFGISNVCRPKIFLNIPQMLVYIPYMDPMGIKPLNFTLAVALLSLARSTHIRIAASTGAGILLLGPGDGGGSDSACPVPGGQGGLSTWYEIIFSYWNRWNGIWYLYKLSLKHFWSAEVQFQYKIVQDCVGNSWKLSLILHKTWRLFGARFLQPRGDIL